VLTSRSVLGSGTGLEESGPPGAGAVGVSHDISVASASIRSNSLSAAIGGRGRPLSDWHGQGARKSVMAEREVASRKVRVKGVAELRC